MLLVEFYFHQIILKKMCQIFDKNLKIENIFNSILILFYSIKINAALVSTQCFFSK